MADRPMFVATQDGVDAVIRTGRLRRRRKAAALGSGSLAMVVAGAVALVGLPGGAGGTDRLQTTNGPPNSQGHVPITAPSGPTSQHSTTANSNPTQPGSLTTQPGSHPGPAAGASTAGQGAHTSSGDSRATAAPSPISRRNGAIAASDLCDDDPQSATGWCVRYLGPTTIRRGHTTTLSAEVCRMASFPAASITFTSTREIDLEVSQSQTVWQAGRGEHYQPPGGTVTVASGQCLVWSSPWDTRGSDGFLVVPGNYTASFGMETNSTSVSSDNVAVQITITD